MNDSTITLKLWQVSGTDKAYLFSTTPAESREGFKVWIPVSQIEHITRRPNGAAWKECEVLLSEWCAKSKGLI